MTVQAMDTGAPLVLGGWLPDDVEGGRTGRPDILIKAGHGYLPADVKHHLTLKRAKVKCVLVSSLASPDERREAMGWTATTHRYEDGLQLGHYSRMLQACGYHAGPEWLSGAILGTTQLEVTPGQDPELVFAWHNLTEPLLFTFSRTRGKTRRSLLERYDHEHAFRVKVADVARRATGADDDLQPWSNRLDRTNAAGAPTSSGAHSRWAKTTRRV